MSSASAGHTNAGAGSSAVNLDGPTIYVSRARRNMTAALAVGAAAIAMAATSQTGSWLGALSALDPCACTAALYVFGLFCVQSSFHEWPEVEHKVLALLASALACMLLPSSLPVAARPALWVLDVCVMVAAHRTMVRGPCCQPLSGSLCGRVCVITGCNSGIGLTTAEALLLAGAKVVFACRSKGKAEAAMSELLKRTASQGVAEEQLVFMPLDLSSLASVRRFAELFQAADLPLHLLVLNAGVMLSSRALSEDGLEMTLASNHFGHFLLVNLLLPQLKDTEKATMAADAASDAVPRIVVVSSSMCYATVAFDFSEAVVARGEQEVAAFLRRPYTLFRAYAQSKLANLLFTVELSRRLKDCGSNIPVNAVHPGEVLTDVMRDMHWLIVKAYSLVRPLLYCVFKSGHQGSFCTLHVATSPALATAEQLSGAYFMRLAPAEIPVAARDVEAARRLWELSEKATCMVK
mmetsp:Transcript_28709/g.79000  ORF Transcript_28709/g.79000 Transcript_28709/m.79000 type:complete len:465 (-) Transcript_28709:254-1648(-)